MGADVGVDVGAGGYGSGWVHGRVRACAVCVATWCACILRAWSASRRRAGKLLIGAHRWPAALFVIMSLHTL